MISIKIQNISKDEYAFILNEDKVPKIGQEIKISDGINIINTTAEGINFAEGEIFTFIIERVDSVMIGMLSAYLYDKLKEVSKNKKNKVALTIEEKDVDTEEEEIFNILKELIGD